MDEDERSELWWDWYTSLSWRQRMARWWWIYWPAVAVVTVLCLAAFVVWQIG